MERTWEIIIFMNSLSSPRTVRAKHKQYATCTHTFLKKSSNFHGTQKKSAILCMERYVGYFICFEWEHGRASLPTHCTFGEHGNISLPTSNYSLTWAVLEGRNWAHLFLKLLLVKTFRGIRVVKKSRFNINAND